MIERYYHTLIHLKPIQIRYQLWYRIRLYWRNLTGFKYNLFTEKERIPLFFNRWIEKPTSYTEYSFTFLNVSKDYLDGQINWNETCNGKLWAYNLNYMDYLLQPNLDETVGCQLIEQFINDLPSNSTGLEPYPIALRSINWIKFLSNHNRHSVVVNEAKQAHNHVSFDSSLYAQFHILLDNLEYHLLANHLLEDSFSLLFGAFYFKDEKLYRKASEILKTELTEQILDDGGHFELSPMYHQIILERLLDCVNLVQNNNQFEGQLSLLTLLKGKAIKMLHWLNYMTFYNDNIPLFNDSAYGIAPSTQELNQYSIRLGILFEDAIRVIRHNSCKSFVKSEEANSEINLDLCNLSESGYRRFNGQNYECIIDIGQIGPSYQPGHAHADSLGFVLNVNNCPIFIDQGISTYEPNQTRLDERGTSSHNSVTVNKENSSKVWSSFRVAKRAKVFIQSESGNAIIAKHNGFQDIKTTHQRQWIIEENMIKITDQLDGSLRFGTAHFWLSHQIIPQLINTTVQFSYCTIEFENAQKIKLIKTKVPLGFNKYIDSYKIEVTFETYLASTINTLYSSENTFFN